MLTCRCTCPGLDAVIMELPILCRVVVNAVYS